MSAIIKKYTWWTLLQCKFRKSEEITYNLIAVTLPKNIDNGDSADISRVSREVALDKIASGAVVFGIHKSAKFKQKFEFRSIPHNDMLGSFDAVMTGVFELNYEDLAALCALLFDLSKDSKKKEWSETELQTLLNGSELTERLEAALKQGVNRESPHDLLTAGNSAIGRDEFPPWLKVPYLHTKFTCSTTKPLTETEQLTEAQGWEEEYNKKVEAVERKKAEIELNTASRMLNLEALNQEHAIKLAEIEAKWKFFRAKFPGLASIVDLFNQWGAESTKAYARILIFLARHPILSPFIILAVLLSMICINDAFVPSRVQIRIDGQNESAAVQVEEAARKYFAGYNESAIALIQVHLQFSDVRNSGRITNEFLLRKKYIADFEKAMKDFARKNQSSISGKMQCAEEGYSFFDGGLKFLLKKRLYVITVKDAPVEKQQEVILLGRNSHGSDLEKLLGDQYAEDGKVRTVLKNGKLTFRFQLRSGMTIRELRTGIRDNFHVGVISGDNPLTIDARGDQEEAIKLNVANLSKPQIEAVEKMFGISFLYEKEMEVDDNRQNINQKLYQLEKAGVTGDWQNKNAYVFRKIQVSYFRIEIRGRMNRQLEDIFSSLQKNYSLTRTGSTYTMVCLKDRDRTAELKGEIKRLVDHGYLKQQGEPVTDGSTMTIVYTVLQQVKIDLSSLSSVADRRIAKEILGGTGNGNTILVDQEKLTSGNLAALGEKHIELTPDDRAVKQQCQELFIVIQGTPDRATLACLSQLGFRSDGNGNHSAGYYMTKEKNAKLAALNALAPALKLIRQDNGKYIYLQNQYVRWSASGLPEVEKQIAALMNGRMDGYLSEDELKTILPQFNRYEVRCRRDDRGILITVSNVLITYDVMFFLGTSDDYGRICAALRNSCGQGLQFSSPRGNPPYFTFRVMSPLDGRALKEALYESAHAACSSVAGKNIIVREGKR